MLGETADIRPFYLIIHNKKKVSWTERKLNKTSLDGGDGIEIKGGVVVSLICTQIYC